MKMVCRFLAGPFAGTSDSSASATPASELSPPLTSLNTRTVDWVTAGCAWGIRVFLCKAVAVPPVKDEVNPHAVSMDSVIENRRYAKLFMIIFMCATERRVCLCFAFAGSLS